MPEIYTPAPAATGTWTEEEIRQAFEDFRMGKFGYLAE